MLPIEPEISRPVPIEELEEQPPIGGTWRRLYTIVLIVLVVETAIFYWFTKAFE